MADFYNERVINKTRKEHKCFGCCKKFPIGSTVIYISGVYEGNFNAYYLCDECDEYITEYPDIARDGYEEGEIGDAMKRG